jgi:phage terminase small subunit
MAWYEGLTTKQRAFVEGYVMNLAQTKKLSQTQIAINAGYTETHATVVASQNLSKTNIRKAIDDLMAEQSMPKNEVLYHFAQIARGEIKDSTLSDRLGALKELAKYYDLTNHSTVNISWQNDAINLIKAEQIGYQELVETVKQFGEPESLAEQLFKQAGVSIEVDE